MTTQEIKDLVAAKIAGQGNQIDLGNALPEIIDALCGAVDSIPKIPAIEITRELTTEPMQIPYDEFTRYKSNPILLYKGNAYVISAVNINQFTSEEVDGTVFCKFIEYTHGVTDPNVCLGIGIYATQEQVPYIFLVEY